MLQLAKRTAKKTTSRVVICACHNWPSALQKKPPIASLFVQVCISSMTGLVTHFVL
jgi:hypothetical protein